MMLQLQPPHYIIGARSRFDSSSDLTLHLSEIPILFCPFIVSPRQTPVYQQHFSEQPTYLAIYLL